MAVLYNYMPGYINSATNAEPTIFHYARKNGIADTRYLVNTLKAFFGDAATAENDYAYAWLPKRDAVKDYGTLPMFEDALAGKLKMLWIVGPESRGDGAQPDAGLRGDGQARHARAPGDLGDGDGDLLAAIPRRRPRSRSKTGNPAARRVLHGKERHHFELGRHGASGGTPRSSRRGRPGPMAPSSIKVFRAVRNLVHDSKEPRRRDHQQGVLWTCTTAEDVLEEIGTATSCATNPETGLKKGRSHTQGRRSESRRFDFSSGAWIHARGLRQRREPVKGAVTRRPTSAGWASILASAGPGRTTCASSTTARRATATASRIRGRNRSSGGTRLRSAGPDMTCRMFRS